MSKRERIRVLRERIEAGGAAHYYEDDFRYEEDVISDDDTATLLTFSDQLDLHDYSDNRHEELLRHTVRLSEKVGGLTDALEDRKAAEALVRWINTEYSNPRTKCD